jgi:alpha-1,2-mannosyltransferase
MLMRNGRKVAEVFGVRMTPRLLLVLGLTAVFVGAFALAIPAWQAEHHSLIRLLHFWLVTVQGDDSWKPMRAAYAWFVEGHGETIYRHILFDEQIKFQYPPSSLLLFAIPEALHFTVTDRELNFVGWCSVLVEAIATAALTLAATRDWPERRLRWLAAAGSAALALTFYPVLWAYKEGQIQLWFTALFALASLAFFHGHRRTSGVLIGLTCIAKPQFFVFLLWALLRRQWGFAGAMGAVVAIGMGISLAVFGWANHVDYVNALSFMSHHGESFVRNYSVNGIMHRLLGNGYALAFVPRWYAPYHPVVYWTTVASSMVLIGFALFWRRSRPTNLIDFFIAALSLTMASPIAWEHHYGVLPPMFVILALMLARRERRSVAMVAALYLAFLACDVILPPIKSIISGPASLLQSPLFFGALTVLVLLYRLRDEYSEPHENPAAVEHVPEQPANQRVGEGAQQRSQSAGSQPLENLHAHPAIGIDVDDGLEQGLRRDQHF